MSDYKVYSALPKGWVSALFGQENLPSEIKWSGIKPPPAIGERVKVNFNNLGDGVVEGYFSEAGWLGVLLRLVDPPQWWKDQNKANLSRQAHVFGAELVGWRKGPA